MSIDDPIPYSLTPQDVDLCTVADIALEKSVDGLERLASGVASYGDVAARLVAIGVDIGERKATAAIVAWLHRVEDHLTAEDIENGEHEEEETECPT